MNVENSAFQKGEGLEVVKVEAYANGVVEH
jgi:hypothetical protein